MADTRLIALGIITGIYFFGTVYSLYGSTYLDTSNPFITHLPHHLHSTHYFASKANWLNVIFIKRAWGWTTAAFFCLWLTSPEKKQTKERVFKWMVTTGVWIIFASWFFGPAVIDRLVTLSGGECVVALPGPTGAYMNVPMQYCIDKSVLSPTTHPSLFASPLLTPADATWAAIPRLRRGHDVSGHVFLITMSFLFLADQLRSSLAPRANTTTTIYHKVAIALNLALMGLWILASYTTAVYFHTPFEKFTGYRKCLPTLVSNTSNANSLPVLGIAGFGLTQLSVFEGEEADPTRAPTGTTRMSVKEAAKRQD